MKFFTIRLKPEGCGLYIGKSCITYGIQSDQCLAQRIAAQPSWGATPWLHLMQNRPEDPPFWFVPEKRAKVWTEAKHVKRILAPDTYLKEYPDSTFSMYEVVVMENGITRVVSADDFIRDWKNYE
jgi:Leu/Phe-tRNA-protein transferase